MTSSNDKEYLPITGNRSPSQLPPDPKNLVIVSVQAPPGIKVMLVVNGRIIDHEKPAT